MGSIGVDARHEFDVQLPGHILDVHAPKPCFADQDIEEAETHVAVPAVVTTTLLDPRPVALAVEDDGIGLRTRALRVTVLRTSYLDDGSGNVGVSVSATNLAASLA